MPVRRSSSDDGSVRVSRKPRVAVGSSRGSEDGIRTPRSEDSGVGRGQRRARVATEGSEGSSGSFRTGEGKKIGSRKFQNRGNGSDAVPYHSGNGRSIDTRGRGKRDWKTKSGSEGFGAAIDGKLGFKRKRISADPGRVEQGMFDGNDRKSRSPYKRNVLNSSMDDGNKLSKRNYGFKKSGQNKSVTESGKFRGSGALDRRGQTGKVGRADKPNGTVEQGMFDGVDRKSRSQSEKNVLNSRMDNGKKLSRQKDYEFTDSGRNRLVTESGKFRESKIRDNIRDNGLGNVKSKISDSKKAPLATKDLNQRKEAVGFVDKRHSKKDQRMKALVNGSDLTEAPRKKKKKGIRIDPYDTSNKRLDDSISDKG